MKNGTVMAGLMASGLLAQGSDRWAEAGDDALIRMASSLVHNCGDDPEAEFTTEIETADAINAYCRIEQRGERAVT